VGSLSSRQFGTHRRVRPGRVVPDERGVLQHEEYATAVVGLDGEPIVADVPTLLGETARRDAGTNRLLEILIDEEVRLDDAV
jgi:hypothetical protein